jgi:predicted peroxiredoxin
MARKVPRWIAALSIVGVLAAFCWAVQAAAPDKAVRDGVFIHVTKGVEHPHDVLMALRMAELMAPDRDVILYFDIKGVEVVLKDAPDLRHKPFASSHTALTALMGKGVTVCACPGCLAAADKSADDLRPGIAVAEKDRFFNFTKGRILTLDY